MKVLQKGREQKGWATEAVCTGEGNGGSGCGARLLVDQGDLFRTSSSHYDGSTDRFVTFRCSECGVETDLENVPGGVVQELPTKSRFFDMGGR